MPIAVSSWEIEVSLSAPLTVELLHVTSDFGPRRARVMTAMISAAIGTVYFSNVRIR